MPSLEDPQGLLTHTKLLQHLFQTFFFPPESWVGTAEKANSQGCCHGEFNSVFTY